MTSSTFHISPNFVNNSVARGRLPLAGARSRRRLSFLLPPVSPPTLVCISPPIVNTILTTITPSVLVLKSSDATSGLARPCPGLLALLPPPSSLPSAFLPRLPHFVATGRSPDDKQPQRLISVLRQLLDLVEAPHPLLPGIFGGFGLVALRVASSLHGGVVRPAFLSFFFFLSGCVLFLKKIRRAGWCVLPFL